jgi:hypothetical protein
VGKLNAREKNLQAERRRKAGLKAAETRASKPPTPSLEQLLRPLTPTQQASIREVLWSEEAGQFLRDWDRISAVGYHYATEQQKNDQAFRKNNQKQLDQEAKSVDTALKALNVIEKQLVTFQKRWQQHWVPIRNRWFPYENYDNPDVLVDALREVAITQRDRIGWYGTERGHFRKGKRGKPISHTRYFLEVVLAYFRNHQWDATIPSTNLATASGHLFVGPLDEKWDFIEPDELDFEEAAFEESAFVLVAFALLGHASMNPATRQALNASSLDYAALKKVAPVLSREHRKRLWATHVSRSLL